MCTRWQSMVSIGRAERRRSGGHWPMDSLAEVHFHDQDVASVFSETTESGDTMQYLEVVHFALFSARTLVNLGAGDHQSSLALLLRETLSDPEGSLRDLPSAEVVGGVSLLEQSVGEGKRRFVSAVTIPRDGGLGLRQVRGGVAPTVEYSYSPKGFGMLGRGLGYYAPHSVITLLRYLIRKHQAHDLLASSLLIAGSLVADASLRDDLTAGSQHTQAVSAAWRACWDIEENAWVRDHPDSQWLREVLGI